MQEIYTVHGLWSDGDVSVDVWKPHFEPLGYRVDDIDTPSRNFISARFTQGRDAKEVSDTATDGSILVGHSNGAAIVTKAAERQEKFFKALVLYRPAMSKKYDFSEVPCETKVYVIYHEHDLAIRAGSLLGFWHPFGALGCVGYEGKPDGRVLSIRGSDSGHSDDFRPNDMARWKDYFHKVFRQSGG